uniref:Uncharacterized protein n=1 Tax=Pyramimonas obovata TaxID=1411642 RepID=A0A7S0WFD0_9CHLO|mmetsp:Transcript_24081/g.52555  ORF Transcript_24081/g.52555 Transcript_24081/m.52555 type:complete len:107 (+) Transcript_24081:215-535(+)|eukprot:CAMPEP_0118936716 /NCGR_PEP_ID=MMETSP1169-20130426/20136_1 /TAXON_ID=36882 /ORGANISM="Pyramimonas obovata, Strain CCMP722" /LENGTH=106 /DNA_ID=CAMNT_0006880075 /DNA_START=146 /DNA_END=466 /DNA_ORIENTATION=+
MSRLVPAARDEASTSSSPSSSCSDSSVPVLLYCRPNKSLPYVFCGELGEVEVVGETTPEGEEADYPGRGRATSGRPALVWTLLDYEQLMAESEHFRNLVRFSGVGI